MSLDEYNRHSTLGPMAGPATSAAAAAGQAAHRQMQAPSVTGDTPPLPTLGGSLRVLAFLACLFAAALAALFLLPDDSTGATIASFAALVAGLGFVIFSAIMGFEAVKYALGWTIVSAIEHGWGWIAAVALAAFVFAALHSSALGPFTAWMVAVFAAILAIGAKVVRALRPAAVAVASGATAYVLAASHVFERHSVLALLMAVALAAVVFGVARISQARRARTSAA